ncbi:D-arabinono-1,4-lactone oxidase [Cellulomonas sp. URHD0024]|uniref:D-arabinono-1,4-lactone oxidase n=1 Tax=Cellulomonas sp. URHD0024 TaxID=1302620 RepID=UPI00040CC471|nr:D-arabinono-1,4-lactone oxidase [Cellulomonas sp. URHD0024]
MTLTNWSGNYAYRAPTVRHPRSVEELSEIVASSAHVRALGSRHSFNDLADGPGTLVALDGLPPSVRIDAGARTVTVSAGTRYGTLAQQLHEAGWALGNLASLPHISVAGAVATATHGSGDRSQNLAAAVSGLVLVGPDGSSRRVVRGDDDFAGSVVALGALGIAVEVSLDIEPTYDVAQEVHQDLPWETALANLDDVTSSAGSVSLFTDWRGSGIQQVWRKTRVSSSFAPRAEFYGSTPAAAQLHPLPGIDPVHTTAQLASPGPWHERLPHFRLDFTPSNGAELQTEYLVPRSSAVEALHAVRALSDQIAPLLQVSEIRTIAGDDLWLSTAFGGDHVGIHFTWRPLDDLVAALLPALAAALAPFAARPHWGKLFADGEGDLAHLYPRWDDFRSLVARTDPDGVFRNAFLERHGLSG